MCTFFCSFNTSLKPPDDEHSVDEVPPLLLEAPPLAIDGLKVEATLILQTIHNHLQASANYPKFVAWNGSFSSKTPISQVESSVFFGDIFLFLV